MGSPLPFDDVSTDSAPIAFDPTREQLLEAATGVTGAILGIASYGSVVLRSMSDVDELTALFPERHVVLVRDRDVVNGTAAAFDELAPLFADEVADIAELVYGVLSPREVHVIVIEDVESERSEERLMSADRRRKAAHTRRLLETEGDSVERNTLAFNEGRYELVSDLERYEELKEEATPIKRDAIDRLPELIEQVTETIEDNGGTVYLADDGAAANTYVRRVVGESDAETVVKSKSMTAEEIDLNEHIEAADADVWETDLGEFVLQVADVVPSHIVAPAIHKSSEDIAELFNEHFDPDEPLETADELTVFARDGFGEHIHEADVGITGANFIAADTGTMAVAISKATRASRCRYRTPTSPSRASRSSSRSQGLPALHRTHRSVRNGPGHHVLHLAVDATGRYATAPGGGQCVDRR